MRCWGSGRVNIQGEQPCPRHPALPDKPGCAKAVTLGGCSLRLARCKLLQVRCIITFESSALTPPKTQALIEHILKAHAGDAGTLFVDAQKDATRCSVVGFEPLAQFRDIFETDNR